MKIDPEAQSIQQSWQCEAVYPKAINLVSLKLKVWTKSRPGDLHGTPQAASGAEEVDPVELIVGQLRIL